MTKFKKIRVLRVVTSSECVIWHMGKTLQILANDCDVSVAGKNVTSNQEFFLNVQWFNIPIERKVRPLTDIIAFIQLCLLCYRIRPDIVHSVMPKAGLLAAAAGWVTRVPVRIHTFTGQVWDTKKGLNRWLYKQMDKLIIKLNTACLTDSPSQSRHLFDEGISDLNGGVIPVLGLGSLIGVNFDRFDTDVIAAKATITRNSLGLNNDHFVIGYIARKSLDKGAIDMLRGFEIAKKRSPNMRLLFIGPDESDGKIEMLRAARPELYELVIESGAVNNHEEYLLACDLICLPSYREGFGSIILEGAALGVPSIGSRIAGLQDSIVDNQTGILFPAGDIEQMADCLCTLEGNRPLVSLLGFEAKKRARKYFSSEIMTKLLQDFYFTMLNPNK
jgi:glycosyltransferase involved in cell wall biosynthesis